MLSFAFFAWAWWACSPAAPESTTQANTNYPTFVEIDKNEILYTQNLKLLYKKLQDLYDQKRDRVTIVHIGDSHLQAGHFPAELSRLLSKTYGSAGQGLVFPLQVAKTSAMAGILSSSSAEWTHRKIVVAQNAFENGIAGYVLQTTNAQFQLTVDIRSKHAQPFNKITLLTKDDPFQYEVRVHEGKTTPSTGQVLNRENRFTATFDAAHTAFRLVGKRTTSAQNHFTLYGAIVEDTNAKGILYHTIGVNGAMFSSYNRAPLFWEQLASLQPDFIIISLGTNEAFDTNLTPERFSKEATQFLENLHRATPCRDVLFTAPNYIRIRSRALIAKQLQTLAEAHQHAFWNFHAVMGGTGSIAKWYASKLAQSDKIHLTPAGYIMQGNLLHDALTQAAANR